MKTDQTVGNITVHECQSSFALISKQLISDLDINTIGVYSKIMVLGKRWCLNVKGLSEHLKISDKKIRSILVELENHGYMRRVAVKSDGGKFKGWEYHFYSTPQTDRTCAGRKKNGHVR